MARVPRIEAALKTVIIEGVALVEGGARKERLEFPGGAFQGQPPPAGFSNRTSRVLHGA